jgi:hypothetical protein
MKMRKMLENLKKNIQNSRILILEIQKIKKMKKIKVINKIITKLKKNLILVLIMFEK